MLPIAAIAFFMGIMLALLGAGIETTVGLLLSLLAAWCTKPQSHAGAALFFVVFLAIGFFRADFALNVYKQSLLPHEQAGMDKTLIGIIDELPQRRNKSWRIRLKTDAQYVQLNVYDTEQQPEIGQRWTVIARLKPPHGFSNEGGFNYEQWLLTEGVHATGYVRDIVAVEANADKPWRQVLWNRLAAYQNPAANLVAALVLGERQNVARQDQQLFINTGTAHLFAISGLHIGLLAGFSFAMCRLLLYGLLLLPSAFLRRVIYDCQPRRICIICSGLLCIAYAALADFSIPTQRALIMLGIIYMAWLGRQPLFNFYSIAFAFILVLCLQPLSALSAGFYLSFAAVAWIAILLKILPSKWSKFRKGIAIQLLLPVLLWPMVQFWFGQAAGLGALANLLLIPLVTVAVLPLCLLCCAWEVGFPGQSGWLLYILDCLYTLALNILNLIDGVTLFKPFSISLGWLDVILITLSFLVLLLWSGRRWLSIAPLLILLILLPKKPLNHGEFNVAVLDVGQGLSTVVHTQNHVLVYDTGPAYPSGFNTAQAVLIPYLQSQNIKRVDTLIISHDDGDHNGGVEHLADTLPVKRVLAGQADKMSMNAQSCNNGQSWQWDGVHFNVLWPNADKLKSGAIFKHDNNHSCVISIEGKVQSALLTGDIESPVERALLHRLPTVDFLVAPHHGSNSSSSAAFIERLQPNQLAVSAGLANRFGHPHSAVLERYRSINAHIFKTTACGRIRYTPQGVQCYRQQKVYRWNKKGERQK